MAINRIQKSKFERLMYFSVFLMIYVSNETIIFGSNLNTTYSYVGYVITSLLTLFWLGKGVIGRKQGKTFFVCILLICLNLSTMLFNMDINIKYGYVCVIILLAYAMCQEVPFPMFVKAFKDIVAMLAVVGLIGFVLYRFLYPILTLFPIVENESGFAFYNLGLSLVMQRKEYYGYRCFGIFREPGVFAVYLLLALLFELFDKHRHRTLRPARIVILSITMLITYSTAGYIIVFILLMTFLFSKTSNRYYGLKIALFFGIICAVLLMLASEKTMNMVFAKLFVRNASTDSRVGAIWTNLSMAFRDLYHLLAGNGFNYVENNFSSVANDMNYKMAHNTNTVLKILSVYGVAYASIVVIGFYRFCQRFSNNIITIIGIILSLFLMFSNEDFIVNSLLYFLLFYAYKYNRHKGSNRRSYMERI